MSDFNHKSSISQAIRLVVGLRFKGRRGQVVKNLPEVVVEFINPANGFRTSSPRSFGNAPVLFRGVTLMHGALLGDPFAQAAPYTAFAFRRGFRIPFNFSGFSCREAVIGGEGSFRSK